MNDVKETKDTMPKVIYACDLCIYSKGRNDINCYRKNGCEAKDGEYYSSGNNFTDSYYNNQENTQDYGV